MRNERTSSPYPIMAAGIPDLPSLMLLIGACIGHMRQQGIEQWDELYPDRATLERDIAAGTLFIASEQGAIQGMIVLNELQPKEYETVPWRDHDGRPLVVHRLAVAPAWQGRGVASQLMQFAETYGRRNGYGAIRLDAFVHNPSALRLYARLGYRNAGTVQFRKGPFHCFEKSLAAQVEQVEAV
jgi:GNAT superfamily N-acetyltransferase